MGVRSAAEVRRHLKTFVQNELCHGENPPSQFSRRYYPTDSDIRNILHASRIGERKAPDDQINLQIKCKEWKESNAEDFIFYRVCKFTLFCNFKLPFNSAPRAKNQTTIEWSDVFSFKPSAEENNERVKFLFVYQADWMKRLLVLYGQEMCLMDATYRTCRYNYTLVLECTKVCLFYKSLLSGNHFHFNPI